ncbi:hypothetical protein HNV10_15330 [Winogradskyella litoriviva]|uniref:Co-chaperone DjlA N-terminal domain-containing protein n=1 Tax=Winogradskyella litoriviva TaxID=1220182 RepID=A0ABX2E8S4_9FLAO|nr:hypothetical protein [Winogradskyella litoriviva]NRD24625.1 hypothetical protein [Winogradskyella litoriviva]
MKVSKHIALQFCQNLGKLFYAFAAVDKSVNDEEISTVKRLVEKYWLQQDLIVSCSQNDAKNAIIDTFNWLCKDMEYDAQTCYNSFINFKKQNNFIFTEDIKKLIIKTVGKISSSFSGQNKSELILLAKLNIELKKLNT